ncbi:MAG: METTL5 family protein [Thermoplasmata archaeon]
MRRMDLVRSLDRLSGFPSADPRLEQVATPTEAAVELLETALGRGDIAERRVLDLGCGTGVLAVGAKLLDARTVTGVDVDPVALGIARANAQELGVAIEWVESEMLAVRIEADTVVMNPPFGAQRRHADRSFWDRAFALAGRAVYAFALAPSRTFIEGRAVAAGVSIELTRPVRWEFPRSFAHHRRAKVELPVDLWVLRRERTR